MTYIKALIQAINLIKLMVSLYNEWRKSIDEKREQRHSDGIDQLKRAKTEKEIRDALDEIADNP